MAKMISLEYRRIAEEFARRLSVKLGKNIDAVVLYGSVSRGEAKKKSDIDVLVLTKYANNISFTSKLYDILVEFEKENDFGFFISLFLVTPEQLKRQVALGTPFIRNVSEDAMALYGRSIFEKFIGKLYKTGR
jgi:predicted nucleotidyltransferase